MKKTEFFDLVAEPNLLNEASLPALNEIIADFPWFQTARMLLVKNLHLLDHVRFNGELKLSAAFIGDRARLFQLIHQKRVESSDEAMTTVEPVKKENAPLVEAQEKKRSSSVGLTTRVKSVADYFQTDDVFESNDTGQVDFSFSNKIEKKPNEDAIVLPSADFPAYDSTDFVGYELKEAVDPAVQKSESHSFFDWLSVLRHTSVHSEEKTLKKKSHQLIDNFLNTDMPRMVTKPLSEEDKPGKIKTSLEESTMENDDLMSETLANIYIKQKYYTKAIGIYEKLRLKYPEKNVYFAQRISDLEKLTN